MQGNPDKCPTQHESLLRWEVSMIDGVTLSNPAAKGNVRDQAVGSLCSGLMGPCHPKDKTDPIEEFQTTSYIVGHLTPQELKIDDVENDVLSNSDDDGEIREASFETPQVLDFMLPSLSSTCNTRSNAFNGRPLTNG